MARAGLIAASAAALACGAAPLVRRPAAPAGAEPRINVVEETRATNVRVTARLDVGLLDAPSPRVAWAAAIASAHGADVRVEPTVTSFTRRCTATEARACVEALVRALDTREVTSEAVRDAETRVDQIARAADARAHLEARCIERALDRPIDVTRAPHATTEQVERYLRENMHASAATWSFFGAIDERAVAEAVASIPPPTTPTRSSILDREPTRSMLVETHDFGGDATCIAWEGPPRRVEALGARVRRYVADSDSVAVRIVALRDAAVGVAMIDRGADITRGVAARVRLDVDMDDASLRAVALVPSGRELDLVATSPTQDIAVHTLALDNETRAAIGVAFSGGAAYDPPDAHGRAALLAQIVAACARARVFGARVDEYVTAAAWGALVEVPRTDVRSAVDAILDCSVSPTFDRGGVDAARDAARMDAAALDARMRTIVARALAPDSPGLVAPLGAPATLARILPSDLDDAARASVRRDRVNLVVASSDRARVTADVIARIAVLANEGEASRASPLARARELVRDTWASRSILVVAAWRTAGARAIELADTIAVDAGRATATIPHARTVWRGTGAPSFPFAAIAVEVEDDETLAAVGDALRALERPTLGARVEVSEDTRPRDSLTRLKLALDESIGVASPLGTDAAAPAFVVFRPRR